MTDRPVEPPLSDELPEMIQAASEIDDPVVYKILDIQIAKRLAGRAALRGNGPGDQQGEIGHEPPSAA